MNKQTRSFIKPIASLSTIALYTLAIAGAHLAGASLPAFDAASVKLAPLPADGKFAIGYRFVKGGFNATFITMRQCVEAAYDVPGYERISGPDWITSDSYRYSITAKASGATSQTDLHLMLQDLLAVRFGLRLHSESEERPVYALERTKGKLSLLPVQYDGDDRDMGIRPTSEGIHAVHTSMSVLANVLSTRMIGLDRPVLDMTGLQGLFDFTLSYATNGHSFAALLEPSPDTALPSIFSVGNLGLTLKARQAPVKVWLIDNAERVPSPN
jgi:uncharacterized protein (TIGR03435 family)